MIPIATAAADVSAGLSVADMVGHAGPVVRAVMAALVVCSVLSWTVGLVKAVEFGVAAGRGRRALLVLAASSSLADAAGRLAGRTGVPAALVRAAAAEHRPGATAEGAKERAGLLIERIVAGGGRRLARGLFIPATIGATAPFIGLFGTVWGVMDSFVGIARSHSTSLAAVAPGIAEALLCTAIGLLAAVPAVMIYNLCGRAIAGARGRLQDAAAQTMRLLSQDLETGGRVAA